MRMIRHPSFLIRPFLPSLPAISRPLLRLFAWYSRRYLCRHFDSLRGARTGAVAIPSGIPVVVYSNHASWWDPLVGLQFAEEFLPGKSVFVPMDAADHKGSEQIEAWVRPMKKRNSYRIAIEGMADASRVPATLRRLVRRWFKEKFLNPVMLDWTGKVVKRLKPAPSVANIYAVHTNGMVLLNRPGAADEKKLARLFPVLDAHSPAGRPAMIM